MTMVSTSGLIQWPQRFQTASSPGLNNIATLTAAGHYVCYISIAQEDMVISHVGFRVGTCTGSPTADCRIETVATTGLPSGTLWATNTNIVTGTLSTDTNVLNALTAAATITKGQVFAVKIAYNSGTSFIPMRT